MSEDIQEEGQGATSSEQGTGWDRLRVEREAQGLSLDQVSAYLKLTARQIEAIEKGDLTALPGAAFSRGFVKNYARFLKLDPAPFLGLIESADGQHEAHGLPTEMYSANLGRMPSSGDQRFTALPILGFVLVLVIVAVAGWYYHWFESREEAELLAASAQSEVEPVFHSPMAASQPPAASAPVVVDASGVAASAPAGIQSAGVSVPAAGLSAPEVAPAASAVARLQVQPQQNAAVRVVQVQSAPAAAQSAVKVAPQSSPRTSVVPSPAQSVVAGMARAVLAFSADSWVEVRDGSGKSVFSRMNQAGSVQEVQGVAPFTFVIGNAPQVKLTWKGRPVDLTPYIRGDVARLTVQ